MNPEIFLRNLDFFYQRYPYDKNRLHPLAEEFLKQNYFDAHYKLETTENKRKLFENGRLIDLEDDPPSSPAVNTIDAVPARNLILLGLGFWSRLENAFFTHSSETKEFYVIEPNIQRFFASLWSRDVAGNVFSKPTIHWMIGLESQDVGIRFLQLLRDKDRLRGVRARNFVEHPLLASAESTYYQAVKKEWDSTCIFAERGTGHRLDSMVGLENTIQNSTFIESNPGIELLKNQFEGVPSIVISTGPSLAKSLDQLRSLQDKALLISADASLKILLENEIVPHFVLTMERDECGKPFFELLHSKYPQLKSHLVAYPVVPHSVLTLYPGPKWVAYMTYEFYGHLEGMLPRGVLPAGHSVAHMAACLGSFLGSKEVFLVGQDLSFDPDTLSSHPAGIAYEEWSHSRSEEELKQKLKREGHKLYWWPGNLRDKVPTFTMYLVFLMEFVELISQIKAKITNCTEGGAKIPGIDWRRLEDVSKDWIKRPDFFSKLDKIRARFQNDSSLDFSRLAQYLEITAKNLSNCRDILSMSITSIDKNFVEARESFSKVLAKLRRDFDELVADRIFRSLTSDFLGFTFFENENRWYSRFDRDETLKEKAVILKEEYESLTEIAAEVRAVLRQDPNRRKYSFYE